jgi:hypothetical protein
MIRAAPMLLLASLLVAAEPLAEDDDIGQELIAEIGAGANGQMLVFVHLNDAPPHSVIGALVMPCNPLWAEGCEIPVEPLARMLRDAGASLTATCDRATVYTLKACLPGFEVLPSLNGGQLYLTTRRT